MGDSRAVPTMLVLGRPDGTAVSMADGTFTFRVSHRHTPHHVSVECGPSGALMRFAGEFAPLPFTAEAPEARQALLDRLGTLCKSNEQRFVLASSGLIQVVGDRHIDAPVTPVHLISAVSEFIAAALPDLSILADCLGTGNWTQPQALKAVAT